MSEVRSRLPRVTCLALAACLIAGGCGSDAKTPTGGAGASGSPGSAGTSGPGTGGTSSAGATSVGGGLAVGGSNTAGKAGSNAGGSSGTSSGGSNAAGSPGASGGTGPYLIPSPIISRGKPVLSPQSDAALAFDGNYDIDSSWIGSNSANDGTVTNTWLKINIGTGPTALLWAWHNTATPDYTIASNINYGAPIDYTIDVSPSGADGTWQTRVTVTGANNLTYRSRAHRFDFTGMSWVRMTITKCTFDHSQIAEIDVHDVSAGSDDTWLVAGSNSTRFAYDGHTAPLWPALVHTAHAAYYPALIDIADLDSSSAYLVAQLDNWLALNPDYHFWVLVYGLGEAEGGGSPGSSGFQANMQAAITKLKAAGKMPIIPRVQKTTDTNHARIADFNAIIDQLVATNHLPPAPDLFAWFTAHPEQLCQTGCEGSADVGVVPLDSGFGAMNTLWAQTTDGLYAP